jgi:hypothetical protein
MLQMRIINDAQDQEMRGMVSRVSSIITSLRADRCNSRKLGENAGTAEVRRRHAASWRLTYLIFCTEERQKANDDKKTQFNFYDKE